MPFDAMVSKSLADRLAIAGITPVPMEVLQAHKAAQLRKHRRSLLASPWPYVAFGGLVAGWMLAISHGSASVICPIAIIAGMLSIVLTRSMVMLFCDLAKITILGEAKWFESLLLMVSPMPFVPQPVLDVVHRANNALGTRNLIYGELIQNQAVLDPYVVVWDGDESACLGIWDGDEIIACATMID